MENEGGLRAKLESMKMGLQKNLETRRREAGILMDYPGMAVQLRKVRGRKSKLQKSEFKADNALTDGMFHTLIDRYLNETEVFEASFAERSPRTTEKERVSSLYYQLVDSVMENPKIRAVQMGKRYEYWLSEGSFQMIFSPDEGIEFSVRQENWKNGKYAWATDIFTLNGDGDFTREIKDNESQQSVEVLNTATGKTLQMTQSVNLLTDLVEQYKQENKRYL